MKLGVPWSVKGIRPEARESAEELARRSGMSLGDWLNSVIINTAAHEGIDPATLELNEGDGEDVSAVHARLDDLTRKIDRLTRNGPEAYAPPHVRGGSERADLIGRLDRRLDHPAAAPQGLPPFIPAAPQMVPPRQPAAPSPIERAAAEIAARQRALNGQPPHQTAPHAAPQMAPQVALQTARQPSYQTAALAMPEPPPLRAAPPAQDLSGLEEQLRSITDQIETLRRPGVEEAINALRGELAEIGHALSDAMPRQALDTIERQVQGLSQRIAEGRQSGADADALVGLERGLAEVRDALHGLTPAENLVGFNDAVAVLAEKIDLIVAQKDPATLQQLESAITTLRGISTHIASNETVRQLSNDVAMLADKVDRIANASAAGEALTSLEHRIGALADALTQRSENGGIVPPRLEALVDSLSTKIEQIQLSRGDNIAVGHLEDRIVQLVERLDASDNRLGHLEAIERGLADLLVHIEDIRTQKAEGGIRGGAPGVDALKHDLARTQDALDKVNGTLGHVVDRLAMIENGMRGGVAAAPLELDTPLARPVGKIAARAVPVEAMTPAPAMPMPPVAPLPPPPAAKAAAPAMPKAPMQPQPPVPATEQRRALLPGKHRPAINPDLPPDLPLEPGSGHPNLRGNLAERIAASEAALGSANPTPDAPATGKSGFLNAARRAAKAALSQPAARKASREALWTEAQQPAFDEPAPSLRAKLTKRVKTLFVAASVIAIVIGALQIGSTFFGQSAQQDQSATGDKLNGDAQVAKDAKDAAADKKATSAATIDSNATVPPAAVTPLSPSFGVPAPPAAPANPAVAPDQGSLLISPAFNSPDITGSIRRQPGRVAAATGDNKLPAAIGGPFLRNAANGGDAAAAYEIAVRFADGRGIPANSEEAARWFERASRDGLAPAQFRLGSLYEKGNGVKKDLGQARRLYAAAAAKGNAKAMHNLAVLYAEGIDGKPDYAAAAQWFQKAAAHGVSDSQYNLGILCARGLGTEKSLAESYKWFALAANRGDHEAAKKRDEIASRLDPKALAAMEHTVKIWTAVPQPDIAITVPAPDGGWDRAADAASTPAKPKRHDTFKVGNR
jgi:localization factor PodJL